MGTKIDHKLKINDVFNINFKIKLVLYLFILVLLVIFMCSICYARNDCVESKNFLKDA